MSAAKRRVKRLIARLVKMDAQYMLNVDRCQFKSWTPVWVNMKALFMGRVSQANKTRALAAMLAARRLRNGVI